MRQVRVVKWLGILALLLATSVVVGGGILYATASASRAVSPADQGERQGGTNEAVARVITGDSERGVIVAAVVPDGPAAKAGLVRGDILLKIDDQPVNNLHQLQRQLAALGSGDKVLLTVLHGDEERSLAATLEERDGRPFLGLTPCSDLCLPAEASVFAVPLGTVIARVVPESPAEQAGLREGDTVIAVDGQELGPENDLEDLITAHLPGDTVTLEIERPGEDTLELTAELAEHPEREGVAYLGVEYLPLPSIEGFKAEIDPFAQQPFDAIPPYLTAGVFVLHVAADSPAEEAGLRPGDVITAIDGKSVEDDEGLVAVVSTHKPGDTVTLEVERPGEEPLKMAVKLGEHPEKEGSAYLGVEYLAFQLEGFEGNFLPFEQPPLPLPQIEHGPFILQGEGQE